MSVHSAFVKAISVAVVSAGLAACATADGPVARSTGGERQAAIDSLTNDTPPSSLEMASGQCWMAQEKKQNVNNLDAKIAAVDACIADKKRKYPNLPN